MLPVINTLFNGYNLWSSVFASQAFYEMASIAEALGDAQGAAWFRQYDEKIEEGVQQNLVTEYNGLTIYGEMIDADHDNEFWPGFSWVSLTPIYAQWHAINWETMGNTIQLYTKYSANGMGGKDILDSTVKLSNGGGTISGLTYAETIAATAMYYYFGAHNLVRTQSILNRVEALADEIYFETVNVNGIKSDVGNQFHCSAMCLAVTLLTQPEKNTDISFTSKESAVLPVSMRLHQGESFLLPTAAQRTGYVLSAWVCQEQWYQPGETVTASESMSFAAVWAMDEISLQTVMDAITAIGEVTRQNYSEKLPLIQEAEAALADYITLYGEDMLAKIENRAVLEQARATCDELVKRPLGDINQDGVINASDALLALQHSVQLIARKDEDCKVADVNRDETVDASDALKILQHSVGLI